MATVIIYPFSWNSNDIRRTCGNTADRFYSGDCSIRWAYFLAVIGCLDAIVLATLAFILAVRHVKLQPEPTYGINSSLFKGMLYISNNARIKNVTLSVNLTFIKFNQVTYKFHGNVTLKIFRKVSFIK